jgi:pyridoxal phosphate enzyme (YggS family)
MERLTINKSVTQFLNSLPENVILVAAAKTRTYEEVKAAVDAGIKILGYNYLQEAENMYDKLGKSVKWHMIGHLQRNKAKKAAKICDMIETIDSYRIAAEIDKYCKEISKTIPVLIEINSGREENKSGILPEELENLLHKINDLSKIQVQGLMTMGPVFGNPEDARPYFKATKGAFDRLCKDSFANTKMQYLSMGMSNSYQIALEEGANIIRIGTKLFGSR